MKAAEISAIIPARSWSMGALSFDGTRMTGNIALNRLQRGQKLKIPVQVHR
jgi:outer membrane usher protein FimD/PapC